MKLKNAVLAVLAGTAAIAAPAFADNGWHGERNQRFDHGRFDRGHERFERSRFARPVVVVPRRVVVPPRVVYAPVPYYYTPAPVYYHPAPPVVYSEPGISIGFRLPL